MSWRVGCNVLSGLGIVALLACVDDPTGLSPADVAGTYALVAYQGASIPAITHAEPGQRLVAVWSGDLILREDRSFAMGVVEREATLTTVDERIAIRQGTYTVAGQQVSFAASEPFTGDVRSDTLMLTIAGVSYRFVK